MPDISSIRRHILLAASATAFVGLALFTLVTPVFIHLSPQATQEVQRNVLLLVAILVCLLGALHRYLSPIHRFGQLVRSAQKPSPDLAQQARTRAFSAPVYIFGAPLILTGLVLLLVNLLRLVFRPGDGFSVHVAHSLLLMATCVAITLAVSTLSRRLLRPVLVAAAEALPADAGQDHGRRYSIGLRLAVVVLALNFIVFYFLGVLAFNQVHRTAIESSADQFRQWANTLNTTAPYLNDERLIALITDAEIVHEHHAALRLVTPAGDELVSTESAFPEQADALAWGELVEHKGQFTLVFPIERPTAPWRLTVSYRLTPENTPTVRNTVVTLFVFGAIVLATTLLAVRYLADDITRDLKYVTARLLDIASRGHVGDKVPALSLDEVGDLIAAFDQVRQVVTQQQSELGWRVEQMRQLNQASLALASNMDFQLVLDRICQVARDITDSDSVALFLYDPDADVFTRASQLGDDAAPPKSSHVGAEVEAKGMTRAVFTRQQSILVHDARQHPLVDPAALESGLCSIVAVPVISRTQAMGVLYVNSRRPRAYDERDVQAVSALASQAAAAIENARLLDETMASAQALEQRARNLLMINRISTDLTALLDPYEIFKATARHMVQLMQVDHCGILIFNQGAAEGVVVAEYPEIGTVGLRLPRTNNPAIDHVLNTKMPLAVSDIRQEPMLAPVRAALEEVGVRAILIAPLIARDQVIGTIGLDVLHQPHEFGPEEQELCRTVAAQAAIAVSNARLLYDLQQQSRALSRKSQELAQESSRLDAILTHMADGLVVTDLAGRIILSNPAFKAIAGLPVNRSLRGRLLDGTFSAAALRQVIAKALAEPEQVATANIELADGRVLKATASALRTRPVASLSNDQGADPLQAGQVTGVVTVLRDITHEVKVDRMKSEFISAVSHELRTPLTSILGFANLIQREFQRRIGPLIAADKQAGRAAERIMENLNIIESESQRLTRLINDVLDIAKMESGRLEWHMASVNMTGVIDDSINATRALAREKNLPIHVELPAQLPCVWGDYDRLIQVTTNLLSNAIKFTERGEITVRGWIKRVGESANRRTGEPARAISLPHQVRPPALIIGVSDTGVGIAKQDLPLVFERFRQVGDTLTGKPAGTGLGLSICREIVSHHGGTLWVESELRAGSTFYFWLPLSPEHAKDELLPAVGGPALRASDGQAEGSVEQGSPSATDSSTRRSAPVKSAERGADAASTGRGADAASTGRGANAASTGRGANAAPAVVLIVDDEPHIRNLLRQVLHDAGYHTIEAADGAVALERARAFRPDLIILDILMPGASGFGVTSVLRTDPDTAHIPIVILSIADDAGEALELGANAWLTKPVDQARLIQTIETLLVNRTPVSVTEDTL